MLQNRQYLGKLFENQSVRYLEQQGLKLINRNYHSMFGEIDLIMMDETDLVFAEVRYRSHFHFGHACETVSKQKQQKIMLTSQDFLKNHSKYAHLPCRFDIIGISKQDYQLRYDWIKAAFALSENQLWINNT